MRNFKVGIVGGTSLLAGYIINYLSRHRYVDLIYIDSEHNAGERAGNFHKYLKNELAEYKLDKYNPDFIKSNLDLVFIAKPHRISMKFVKELYNDKLKIIDLSGDFRIKEKSKYEKWYNSEHIAEELIKKAVYGLSEIYKKDIKRALLIANPGCYPTGILLALYPAIKMKILKDNIIHIDSYSGVSGAGKNPVPGKNLFLDAFNNIIAYKVKNHQHTPEIEERLNLFNNNKEKIAINFIPHITSIENGIFNTIFFRLNKVIQERELFEYYKEIYRESPFIKIVDNLPEIKDVVDTNYTYITIKINERTNTLLIFSVIDNRIKGGAGQAVQNMNIMLNFDEREGLI